MEGVEGDRVETADRGMFVDSVNAVVNRAEESRRFRMSEFRRALDSKN